MSKYLDILKEASGSGKDFAFLHSSATTPYSDGRSIIATNVSGNISADSFDPLERSLSCDRDKFENAWFGYLSYDLKNKLEDLTQDKDFFINYPLLQFNSFRNVAVFESQNILSGFEPYSVPEISYIKSNMTKDEYLGKLLKIKELISKGDIYQANLTRKFYGEFASEPDAFSIFAKLSQISPAPYSSYMKFGDLHIISSSPELFLKIDEEGNSVTCPIKGSSGKGEKTELESSEKDMAENLMITDLMRNDFSRSCESGSVKVEGLFETSSFETITHMHSTVSGKLKQGEIALSLTKNCFPPGSMTGAPKIMAMEVCSELEKYKRGIYSGALGYFGGDGSAELSVVIRTIIIQGNKFEFQVGGGIVYDSDPEKEWQETMTKAKAIAETLGMFEEIKAL